MSIKDLIEEKSGNVAEINILLHNLLKSHDITVYPLLLSTRENGFITKLYPVISEFNYIILRAEIDGESYFLDTTDPLLTFGEIPFKCLNDYGREMDFENGSRWVNIAPKINSTIQHRIKIIINDDNTFSGTVTSKKTGYNALEAKRRYNKNKQDYLKFYKDEYPDFKFNTLKVEEDDKSDNSNLTETYTISGPLTSIGNKIYLDPFILKFLTKNPLQLNKRTYPVDFGYKDILVYSLKIETTDNYTIIESPKEKMFSLNDNSGSLTLKTKSEDDLAELYFRTNFNKAIYPTTYYQELKSLFNNIVDIQNNSVFVLEKNN